MTIIIYFTEKLSKGPHQVLETTDKFDRKDVKSVVETIAGGYFYHSYSIR